MTPCPLRRLAAMTDDPEFRPIAERAAAMVPDGSVVGLGTGHAAAAFVYALARRVKGGLYVRGVPTSKATADLADMLGLTLTTLAAVPQLDLDFDGADEVDPNHQLIKGYGGALVRERIVAASARQLVILVGPEKLVPTLGHRGSLPVEVVEFALPLTQRKLAELGVKSHLRCVSGPAFVSDNGNPILDCEVPALPAPEAAKLDAAIRRVPGVIDTGYFFDFRPTVLVQHPGGDVEVLP